MSNAFDRCPVCRAPTVATHAPFCSQGCRDRDLLAWLDEGYRIPGPPAEDALDSNGLDTNGLDTNGLDRGARE